MTAHSPQTTAHGEVIEILPQVAPAQDGPVDPLPAHYTPDNLIDDLMDELAEAREMVAYLTRANEALTGQVERLERELSISRMAQVVMDNSVAEVERLTAQNMRLSGMCYDLMRVSPDPVPHNRRSPMEHERDEQ